MDCPNCNNIMLVYLYNNYRKIYKCTMCNYVYDNMDSEVSGYWYDNEDYIDDNFDVINEMYKNIKNNKSLKCG